MTLQKTYDVAVLGAGGAGMAAAIFAALKGKKVLLVERTQYVGGTTALSGGTTWVPMTSLGKSIGSSDTLENARTFLDNAVGDLSERVNREAFLQAGPEAIDTLHNQTDVIFRPREAHPDYMYELEGSTIFGRALEPEPFEAAVLGKDLHMVRPPIPEFTILGGLMVDRGDIKHLLNMKKSLGSLGYSIKLILKYFFQKLVHGRCSRMVMGAALIGRMLLACKKLGVTVMCDTQVTEFLTEGDKVVGLKLNHKNEEHVVDVQGGVILSSGGFGRHPERRAERLPKPTPQYSPAAPGHTGELHDLALGLGAYYEERGDQECFWAPVSHRKRKDGSMAVFPHFVFDRAKPGVISVGKDGKRFVNESRSYHEFVSAMYKNNGEGKTVPVYIITDKKGIAKYGLGMIRPGGQNVKPFLKDGYLTMGATLDELAQNLEIDAANLKQTVANMNEYAKTGKDAEFNRGETEYERFNGDPEVTPNPTLGALGQGPFYAVKLYPGDIGAATGLACDEYARVMKRDGGVIEGLYACGNDMSSIMGGVYPAPGITIGPGIVFGFIAARHATAGE